MTRANQIARLKKTLMTCTHFEDAMRQFLDLVEAHPDVVTDATPCAPSILVKAVKMAAQDVGSGLNGEVPTITLLQSQGMVHGTCLVGRRLGTVLWFDDVRVGLLAVVMSRQETRFTRFRLETASPGQAGRN